MPSRCRARGVLRASHGSQSWCAPASGKGRRPTLDFSACCSVVSDASCRPTWGHSSNLYLLSHRPCLLVAVRLRPMVIRTWRTRPLQKRKPISTPRPDPSRHPSPMVTNHRHLARGATTETHNPSQTTHRPIICTASPSKQTTQSMGHIPKHMLHAKVCQRNLAHRRSRRKPHNSTPPPDDNQTTSLQAIICLLGNILLV